MRQIIVTVLFTPETGQVGLTVGSTGGDGNVSYKEVALALITALESATVGLPDAPTGDEGEAPG